MRPDDGPQNPCRRAWLLPHRIALLVTATTPLLPRLAHTTELARLGAPRPPRRRDAKKRDRSAEVHFEAGGARPAEGIVQIRLSLRPPSVPLRSRGRGRRADRQAAFLHADVAADQPAHMTLMIWIFSYRQGRGANAIGARHLGDERILAIGRREDEPCTNWKPLEHLMPAIAGATLRHSMRRPPP